MEVILLGTITGFAALGVGIYGLYQKWIPRYTYIIFLILGCIDLFLTRYFWELIK